MLENVTKRMNRQNNNLETVNFPPKLLISYNSSIDKCSLIYNFLLFLILKYSKYQIIKNFHSECWSYFYSKYVHYTYIFFQ